MSVVHPHPRTVTNLPIRISEKENLQRASKEDSNHPSFTYFVQASQLEIGTTTADLQSLLLESSRIPFFNTP